MAGNISNATPRPAQQAPAGDGQQGGVKGRGQADGADTSSATGANAKVGDEAALEKLLSKATDGPIDVKGASATEVKGKQAAEVYGTGDNKIPPPSTPKVELSDDKRIGAESFANNLNQVTNAMLLRPSAGATAAKEEAAAVGVGAKGAKGGNGTSAGSDTSKSAAIASGVDPSTLKAGKDLSADQLMAEFLKLNINDPNNSVETHNEMAKLNTTLRQQGIKAAQDKAANANEEMKSAQKYGDQMDAVFLVMDIASIVIGIFTFGAGTVALQAAKEAVKEAIKQAVKEAVKEAVKGVIKEASKTMTKEALQAAIKTATKAATKAATQAAAKGASKEAVKEAAKAAFKESMQTSMQEAMKQGMQQGTKTAMQELGEKGVEELVNKTMDEAINKTIESTLKETAQDKLLDTAAQNMVDEGAKQVGKESGKETTKQTSKEATAQSTQQFANQMESVSKAFNMGSGLVRAGGNAQKASKMSDAQESLLGSKRARMTAEQMQAALEQENEIIQSIMESKNKTVDSVMKMMNAAFSTQNKIMSANMTR